MAASHDSAPAAAPVRPEAVPGGVAALAGISPLQTTNTGRSTIAFRSLGSGPPLVMLTGSNLTLHGWDPELLESLARSARVHILDYPGIGAARFDGEFTVAGLADYVLDFLDAAQLPPVHLLGYSMGGWIAQALALRAPGRVRSLTLVATDCGGPEAVRAAPEVEEAMTQPAADPLEQGRRLLSVMFPPEALPEVGPRVGGIFMAAGEQPDIDSATIDREHTLESVWYAGDGLCPAIEALNLPALVLHGTHDQVIPIENARTLARRLPNAELESFDSAGHGLIYQVPAQLAGAIESRLQRG